MSKVFETYAQRKGVQAASLRFLLDGERIEPNQTPKMLELDDQDQIDCMLEQVRASLEKKNCDDGRSMTNFRAKPRRGGFQPPTALLGLSLVHCRLDNCSWAA
jgi:small ubiquitin-related modifier